MEMATGGVPRCTSPGHLGSLSDLLSDAKSDASEVVVGGLDALAVVDDDAVSSAVGAPSSFCDCSGAGREDRGIACGCQVQACMQLSAGAREWIGAVSEGELTLMAASGGRKVADEVSGVVATGAGGSACSGRAWVWAGDSGGAGLLVMAGVAKLMAASLLAVTCGISFAATAVADFEMSGVWATPA